MPQPANVDSWTKPRRAVLQRPACAALIGAIVAEWAYVEDMLTLMFSASMGSHTVDARGSESVNRNWTALATMGALESIHMRLKVIERTLVPLLPEPLVEQWKDLERALRSAAKERNIAAHSSWGLSAGHPDDLITENQRGQTIRYTQNDFEQSLGRIGEVFVSTNEFMRLVLAAQRAGTVRSAT